MSAKTNQCCKRVYAGSFSGHMCTKPAKHEHEGRLYCSVHYPPYAAERRAATAAKWDKEWQEKQALVDRLDKARAEQKRRANLYLEMLDALRRAALALAFAAESSPAMRDDYEAVSAAIAKATGEQA